MLVIAGTKLGLGSHYESTFLYLNRTELESPSNLLGEGGLGGGLLQIQLGPLLKLERGFNRFLTFLNHALICAYTYKNTKFALFSVSHSLSTMINT